MVGDAQVPQGLGHRRLIADLRGQFERPLQHGNRGVVVAPHELVAAAHPEQRRSLASHIAARPAELRRALEQRQLLRVFTSLLGVLLPLHEEPAVDHAAPGQRQTSLDGVITTLPCCFAQDSMILADFVS
jgi:hypothetical protein